MSRRSLPEADSGFTPIAGLRIHELHWRAACRDAPIVLLHGLASNARIWELCAPRLAEAGFDTWAIDLRGHGLSGKPAQGYRFPSIRADLEHWLRAHRLQRPLLVGHSWGAYLAVEYARHHRTGPARPRGLVLVDGAMTQLADVPGASWTAVRRRLAPPRLAGLTVDQLRQRLTAPGRAWMPNLHAQQIVLANFQVDDRGRIRPHLTRQRHLQLLRSIWEYRVHAAYPELPCPVLLLPAVPPSPRTATEDLYLAEKRKGVARARRVIRDVRVRWMWDTVHDVPLQRPIALSNEILRFAEETGTE
jgi:pimeloyl-ACP methyl ester carboxylesterase